MNRWLAWTPAGLVGLVILVLSVALLRPGSTQSTFAMQGDPLPELELQPFEPAPLPYDPDTVEGPYVLNVWASWCAPCRIEHPVLMKLNEEGIPIYGLVYRDRPGDAAAFLTELGNPFTGLSADPDGRAALQMGIVGVPETFVIDARGNIIERYQGAVTQEVWDAVLEPAYRASLRSQETG